MRKVTVNKCSNSNWWYHHLVGETIKIEDNEFNDDYIAVDKYKRNENDELFNTGMLLKSDCQLIS
jgi:hypothetical protein